MVKRAKEIIGGIIALIIVIVIIAIVVIMVMPSTYGGSTGEPFVMNPIIADESGTIFNIGDIGPAGGIVFFDRGYHADGWRFLEAAPAHLTFTAHWGGFVQYSSRSRDVSLANVQGTAQGIGAGRNNTALIVEHALTMRWSRMRYGTPTPFEGAAQLVVEIDFNGFNDWFLPSKDELNLLHENLAALPQGTNYYWSSTQATDSRMAWIQNVETGEQRADSPFSYKFQEYRVRAIRAF